MHDHSRLRSIGRLRIIRRWIIRGIYRRIEKCTAHEACTATKTRTTHEDAEVRIVPKSDAGEYKAAVGEMPEADGRYSTEAWMEIRRHRDSWR